METNSEVDAFIFNRGIVFQALAAIYKEKLTRMNACTVQVQDIKREGTSYYLRAGAVEELAIAQTEAFKSYVELMAYEHETNQQVIGRLNAICNAFMIANPERAKQLNLG